MTGRSAPRCRRPAGRFVLWLVACLLPLQGLAAGWIAAAGPAHVHKAPSGVERVLDDFRRDLARVAPVEMHLLPGLGHFHATRTPLRHPHPRSDASVVRVAGSALDEAADADERGASPTLAAFVALPATAAAWPALPVRGVRARHRAWTALTHDPEPLERPPRTA